MQVVCGAPNARAGLIGAFAAPGAYVPGIDVTLAVGNIRGVESHGMMCSERELQMSDDHTGIIDLPEDAPVGTSFAAYAGLDDPVIEINLTPNRPDCTGVSGIARDLAAAGLGMLRTPAVEPVAGHGASPVKVRLDFGETPSLCPGFALRMVRGVKNGHSPKWMQQRLIAIGLRPINALVDITNYVTFDRGRPLHVFDAAKVRGNLVVRRAREGEKVLALDEREYELDPEICVIADDNGVESIAGVMGGEHSGCDENDDRRADRVGPLGTGQHRPDRPVARHHHRRPLPLRARRRSGIHGAGPASWRHGWSPTSAAARRPKPRSSATSRTGRR